MGSALRRRRMNSPVVRWAQSLTAALWAQSNGGQGVAIGEEMASEEADVSSIASGHKLAQREHGEAPDEAIRVRSDGPSPDLSRQIHPGHGTEHADCLQNYVRRTGEGERWRRVPDL